ncbi:MAG TPA: polyprenyl synthetase family protein, partial [Acidobacteriota bacterium]
DKTGAIVEALSEIAVVIAGSAESTRQACVSFARNMAVAFQIVDDILNFSEASEWTKTCGEDLKEGKLTYVITRAIELLESSHKERLVEILCDADLRKTPAILREGIELVQRSGALADCRSEAESMFHAAWSQFSASIAPSYAKILLHMLCIRTLHLSGDP